MLDKQKETPKLGEKKHFRSIQFGHIEKSAEAAQVNLFKHVTGHCK